MRLPDDMQVYLWYKGKYYATTLSQINAEDYSLIGWYDAHGSAAGGKIRVLVGREKRLTASPTGCEMERNPVIKMQLGDIFHELSIEILPGDDMIDLFLRGKSPGTKSEVGEFCTRCRKRSFISWLRSSFLWWPWQLL